MSKVHKNKRADAQNHGFVVKIACQLAAVVFVVGGALVLSAGSAAARDCRTVPVPQTGQAIQCPPNGQVQEKPKASGGGRSLGEAAGAAKCAVTAVRTVVSGQVVCVPKSVTVKVPKVHPRMPDIPPVKVQIPGGGKCHGMPPPRVNPKGC